MHRIGFIAPAPGLEEYVRYYAQREGNLDGATLIHPVTARAAPLLEFMFGDPCGVRRMDRPGIEISPRVVVVGVQTHRGKELLIRGRPETFVIFFQPMGLHRLFSIPMDELTDRDFDAHAVLGPSVSRLEQRLSECRSFAERARVTDSFLLPRSSPALSPDGVSAAARQILLSGGRNGISVLAYSAGLSVRQFERRFIRQVGLPPKWYARIVRFEAALESKAKAIHKSWTDVAHDWGYYDQMHMVHDFEEFTGQTPTMALNQFQVVFRQQIEGARTGDLSANGNWHPRLAL